MLEDQVDATCPQCGSRYLVRGAMSYDAGFAPEPPGWFGISSYRKLKALACLECGVVTQFLSRADVEKMRAKYPPQDRPPG